MVGFAPDVSSRVIALLDEHRTRLDERWQAADQASADLLLIDADSIYGHMDWLKACGSGRLVAACTNLPGTYDAESWLRSPILADPLIALLNRISARLGDPPQSVVHAVAEQAPANAVKSPIRFRAKVEAMAPVEASAPVAAPVPLPMPVVMPAPPVPPRDLYLVDLLEADAPLKGRLRLAAEGLATVLLDPQERVWHSASTLKGLAGWCDRALSPTDVQSLDTQEFAAEAASMTAHPYMRLQWLSHLVRGDGHLDAGLDVNARYKLSRWPQSEREFARHFRIATVMLKQATTLDEIAAQAGATIAEVANFVNAYHAVGYIDQEHIERSQEVANRGGLFGRKRKASVN